MENILSKLESPKPQLWIINGRTQEGKSTIAREILRAYKGDCRLYIDPNEAIREGTVISEPESLAYYIVDANARDWPYTITYHPQAEDLVEEIDKIAAALMEWNRPFMLVIDEFFNFSKTGQKLSQKLVRLIRIRAKFPATIVLVSHRPTDIPPAYSATVSRWITFRQTHKPDVDRLRSDTGCLNADRVQFLEKHHFALWSGRELEFFDPKGRKTPPPEPQKTPEKTP